MTQYELTWISNIFSVSRVTKKPRVFFDSEAGIFFRMILPDTEVRFRLIPNMLYYFAGADRENSVLLLNIVLENCKGFT